MGRSSQVSKTKLAKQQDRARTEALVNETKREKAVEEAKRLEDLINRYGPSKNRFNLLNAVTWMSMLCEQYKVLDRIDDMCMVSRRLIKVVKNHLHEVPELKNPDKNITAKDKDIAYRIGLHFRNAHFNLAPYSFHHYLICMEWNYSAENKFYENRYCVMGEWAEELSKLEFGEYEILGLSAPPRSGKTGIGTLFLTWLMGRHPDKSMTFNTHTSKMARKEFQDVITLITDPRREWSTIFPGLTIAQSAEDLWIDISPKNYPNNYKTLYCSSIDTQKAGFQEASWLIYCDDLIGGIEEAMNPARLDNAWDKYTTDILQRKSGNVKILHIATRWSVRDPLTRVEAMNENNPKAKFICVPGLNEYGESNFNFKHNPLDRKHFEVLKESMDEVSFSCIVQQKPIERDGLVFTKDSLSYYEGELPEGEPDETVFACDVAFGGGDYLSLIVAQVYDYDAYIVDVVHSNATKETTKPMVANCLLTNACTRGYFESNAGGGDYAADIDQRLRDTGFRCHIESHRAPPNKTKLSRILDAQSEIKALITDESGYRLHWLSQTARKNKPMYNTFMDQLYTFNQSAKFVGKQHDDAADATAMLVNEVLNRRNTSGRVRFISRKSLAI